MTNFRVGRPWVCVPAAFALLLGFFSSRPVTAQEQAASAAARITQKIDERSLATLRGNTHPLADPKYDLGAAPGSKVAGRLILVLARSAAQEASLQTWLSSVQDPNSPNYHKWLTPDEFGKSFGVSDADLATVEGWLQGQGFAVNKVSPSRMAIEFSGTTAQIQSAFHTPVHSYLIDGVQHWANTSDPQIPMALTPVVAGVARLNDFNPRSNAVRGPSGVYNAAAQRIEPSYTTGGTTNGYYIFLGPADAATIYDTPTAYNASHSGTLYDGTGVTIGIAGDSNIDVTQNANYRATFGLPAKATAVVVDGDDPGENGDAIEAYLDTQVAGGIAPNASVILYTAANTYLSAGLFLAISRAIDDNQADILNVSFGGCEADQGTAGNQYIYDLWQQASAQGISVTVSSGDSGSGGCDNENTESQAQYGLAVNGLASTPYTIAVGGTDFNTLYSNFPTSFTQYVDVTNTLANHRSALKYIPERPWNDSTFNNTTISSNVPLSTQGYPDNIVAAGGGFSACVQQNAGACSAGYPVPSWQTGSAVTSSGRNVPDVSFLAGNGFYGALWGLCTDMDYDLSGNLLTDCAGDPTTGNNFNLTGVGGTSAAAPAFAGMLALIKQKVGSRLGQADYVLYDLAKSHYSTVYHDVSTGNNSVPCTLGTPGCIAANLVNTYYLSGYNASTGYDEASGLGSVDASQLASNWAGAGLAATTSSLTLNGSTAALNITHGTSVQVGVGVTGSGGTPAGNVALVDSISPALVPNSGSIASFTLASGTATGTADSLPGGSYNVSAHYGGSQSFAESDSNSIPVTVSAETSTTALTVQGYYDPATGKSSSTPYYGYIYLVDAQPYGKSASAANPNGAATGTITFKSGSTTLGTAQLASDGIAELQTSNIPGGNDSLTAVFPGDASFQSSTSNAVPFTVQPGISFLTVTTDKEGYNPGDPVTMTATFSSSAGSKVLDSLGVSPTGTVTFIADGSNQLGNANVAGTAGTGASFATASATFTAPRLFSGSHNITATYSGDSNYAPSSSPSAAFIQVISAGTTISLTPNSTTIKQNQSLQLTANLSTVGSLPSPSGTVTFRVIKNTDLTSAWTSSTAVSNGMATVTIPVNALPLGAFTLSANYGGDNYYGSVSVTGSLQVTSSGTVNPTLNLTLPSAPVNGGLPIALTVTGPSGDPVPTGPIIIPVSNNTWTLVNGSVSFTAYYPWQPGSNTITVTYLGDSTYAAGSASGTFTEMGPGNVSVSPQNPTVYVGNALTLAVSIPQAASLPQPTGTITVASGSYTSAATALLSGSASITIPANTLPVGSDIVGITYSGDAYYTAGSSSDLVQVTSTPPGFTISGNNLTLTPGAITGNTSSVTVTPSSGFTGAVTLSAALTSSPAGAVDPPTLSFGTTSPVTISGTGSQIATLTINTTAPSSAFVAPQVRPGAHWHTGTIAFASVLLLGIGAIRRRWRSALAMIFLLVVLAGGAISCGGSGGSGGGGGGNGNSGTTAGAYTITVTATSGTVSGTTTISLTVN